MSMEYLRGNFEVKELDAMGEITGYASTFRNVDRQGDRVAKGAFTDTIAETKGKFPLLWGHNTGRIIGFSTGAEEDNHGLLIHGALTLDADEGRNAYAVAKHAHALKQPLKLSIGYMIPEGGSTWDEAGKVRTLKKIDLLEVSFVAIPANPRAELTAVKDFDGMSIREFEQFLRDSGCSKDRAVRMASHAYAALTDRRESDQSKMIRELQKAAHDVLFANGIREIERQWQVPQPRS